MIGCDARVRGRECSVVNISAVPRGTLPVTPAKMVDIDGLRPQL